MNFSQARFNMVESQIRPSHVTNPAILAALHSIPREIFAHSSNKAMAYCDHTLPLTAKRHLLSPILFAQMLHAAHIQPDERVLDIGCGTGYSTALLGQLSTQVIGLESDPKLAQIAHKNITSLDLTSVQILIGALTDGAPAYAPFDIILLEGMLDTVPDILFTQLNDNGRLIAVQHARQGLGHLTIWNKTGGKIYPTILKDAIAPLIPEFQQPRHFIF